MQGSAIFKRGYRYLQADDEEEAVDTIYNGDDLFSGPIHHSGLAKRSSINFVKRDPREEALKKAKLAKAKAIQRLKEAK